MSVRSMKKSLLLRLSLACILVFQASARAQSPSGAARGQGQPFRETQPPQVVLEPAEPTETPGGVESKAPEVEDSLISTLNRELDRRQGLSQEEATTDPANAPGARPTGAALIIRGIWALAIVLLLIFLSSYLLRRVGRKTPLLAGPSLGKVLGRVHLTRNSSLYFVKTADRVLVVGLTDSGISLVSDFDAALFEDSVGEDEEDGAFSANDFLAQLQTSSRTMTAKAGPAKTEDDEIVSLRGDIGRLQRYLQDEQRETRE